MGEVFFRYEFVKQDEQFGEYHVGFLAGLDDFFDDAEAILLGWIFETDLKCPDIDMRDTKCYFTEVGNRKFRKKIREIKRKAEEKGLGFLVIKKELNELSEILYRDRYQVVVSTV